MGPDSHRNCRSTKHYKHYKLLYLFQFEYDILYANKVIR